MFVCLFHGWKIQRVTRVIREVWTQASGNRKTIVSLLNGENIAATAAEISIETPCTPVD